MVFNIYVCVLGCSVISKSVIYIEKYATKVPSSQGYGSSSGRVWMWELDHKERWALKNWRFRTMLLEKTLESPLDCEEIQPVHPKLVLNIHWKNWCWSWSSNTLATWLEELTHWKRPWCFKRVNAGGEGDDRGWDGWMASPTEGHEFEQAPEIDDGQGCLASLSP